MSPIDKSYLIFLAICAGFASLYLGYRLFIKGIEGSSELEGEIKKVKLTLRNASPGLFFALFGAFIIVAGIYKEEIHTIKIEDGKYTKVIRKGSSSGINVKKELSEEIVQMAIEHRKKNEDSQAKTLYFLALTNDDKNSLAHNNLAYVFLDETKYELALNHAQKAIEFASDNKMKANYYDTLARILVKIDKLSKAKTALELAVELDPNEQSYKEFLNQIR